MRARNIKPGFLKSTQLLKCQPLTRILFIGLWMLSDRIGLLKDDPFWIKLEVLPNDKCDVDKMLNELSKVDLIKRYEIDGIRVIWVIKFLEHQNPHWSEKESKLPKFDMKNQSLLERSGNFQTKRDESCIRNPESGILNPSIAPNGAENGSAVKPTEPSKALTPLQKVVTAFKLVSGHDLADKAWDKEFFPRYSKSASSLLRYLGSWEECADCIQWVWDKMKSKGFECKMETVNKYMADYRIEVMERRKK